MQTTVTIDEARKLTKADRAQRWADRRKAEHEEQAARRERFRVSTEPVTVRLPFPPSLNTYYGTKIVGKTVKDAVAIKYITSRGVAFREAVIRIWSGVGVTFSGRLAIKVVAVFPDNRERDLDGLWKALLDSLEHAGAYENDSQIKAESMEQEAVESPGWLDITLGPKPCVRQGTLFAMDW